MLGSTLRSSGQLYIRLAVVLIAVMAFVANELGLDFLLGAFTAGVLYRIFLLADADAREREIVESKLEAVTFGYLIPIFFVVTGVRFDLSSFGTPTALLKIPLFLGLFLVVRGLPILLYRKVIPDRRERRALALLSATGLPLVVAITTIGVAAGQMRASTEAGLIAAAMLSVIIYPMIGMRLAPRATPGGHPGGGRRADVSDARPAARTSRHFRATEGDAVDRRVRARRPRRPSSARRCRSSTPPTSTARAAEYVDALGALDRPARGVRHQGAAARRRWCAGSPRTASVPTSRPRASSRSRPRPASRCPPSCSTATPAAGPSSPRPSAAGVGLVVLDGPQDVEHLDAVATGPVDVLVRITPGVPPATHASMATAHHGQKFGVTDRRGARRCSAPWTASRHLRLRGIHFHVGSQITALGPFVDAVQRVRGLGSFEVLDAGGGLGVPLTPGMDGARHRGVRARARRRDARAPGFAPGTELIVEPGRSLVARAMVTLYRVRTVKTTAGTTFVAVDGGTSDDIEAVTGLRAPAPFAPAGGAHAAADARRAALRLGRRARARRRAPRARARRSRRDGGHRGVHVLAREQLQRHAAPGGGGGRRRAAPRPSCGARRSPTSWPARSL